MTLRFVWMPFLFNIFPRYCRVAGKFEPAFAGGRIDACIRLPLKRHAHNR